MVDKGMKEFTTIKWSDNQPAIIFSVRTEEIIIAFRKFKGWKYLNDFDKRYVKKDGEKLPVVLIRKNNPLKYSDYYIRNWLTNDN